LTDILPTLAVHGKLISVGLPDEVRRHSLVHFRSMSSLADPPLLFQPLEGINPMSFAGNGALFGSSHIGSSLPALSPRRQIWSWSNLLVPFRLSLTISGSKKEANAMLKLVADHKIKPWIEELPMSKAGEAVERLKKNDVKYRFVLKNDIN
jgi:hypothetical protein